VLEVSTSGYYESLTRQPGPRAERHQRIQQAVQQVHAESHGTYGSIKIAKVLHDRDDLESACRNTVAATMQELGLASCVSKSFTPTTTQADPSKSPAANKLDQDFTAQEPNRKWVTDITYLFTATGWVYLAVVMDLFSRKVVGWSVSTSLATDLVDDALADEVAAWLPWAERVVVKRAAGGRAAESVHPSLATDLVCDALRQAVESRRPCGSQLLHHSDRGCQYTSDVYQQTLRRLGIECSMSRTGCCYDNAAMERFFWSLKHEWTNHQEFADLEEARLSVFKYIETFYNPVRLHQTLGDKSPDQFEADHAPAQAA
jgi:putative transposase